MMCSTGNEINDFLFGLERTEPMRARPRHGIENINKKDSVRKEQMHIVNQSEVILLVNYAAIHWRAKCDSGQTRKENQKTHNSGHSENTSHDPTKNRKYKPEN
jgi:hypothetical protein